LNVIDGFKMEKQPTYQYHYFLDEAGDPVFYGKERKLLSEKKGFLQVSFWVW